MSTVDNTTISDAADDLQPITDLDHFVQQLTAWHTRSVAQVNHMLSIPEGSAVDAELVAGQPTEHVVLEGDALKGFKVGILTALGILGELPFVAEFDETPGDPAAAAVDQQSQQANDQPG